jgi:cytochrome c556
MKRSFRLIVFTALLLCLAGGLVQSFAGQMNDSQNPLRDGMIALDSGYRDVVSAVALGEGEKVQKAARAMHDARGRIAEGLRAGTVVLPKNAQRDKEYLDLDRRFHDKLEALDRAARHNNQREMQRITHMLLIGCVKCHQTFRK